MIVVSVCLSHNAYGRACFTNCGSTVMDIASGIMDKYHIAC